MARPPTDEDFTDFVHAAWPRLYRTAWMLVGDHGQAEDLAQAALATTYASWGELREPAAATAYARTVLLNTARSWFRRHAWQRERPTDELPEHGSTPEPGNRPDVLRALAELPPRQRAVVVLRYFEDLDVNHTARLLGISPGTVKSQTAHALSKLRVSLGDAFVSEGALHD